MNISRRGQYTILAAVGLVLIAGSFLKEMRSSPSARSAKPGAQGTVKGSLGPTPGPNADGYVEDKTTYLKSAAAKNPTSAGAALVSFSRLLAASDVSRAIATMRPDAVFLRFPGADPEARTVVGSIEVTVGARAQELATARQTEVSELEAKFAKAAGGEKPEIQRQISERRQWINELKGACRCVYAVVVGGTTLADLQNLAAQPDMRLVDVPDPVVADLRGWELRPVLPKIT